VAGILTLTWLEKTSEMKNHDVQFTNLTFAKSAVSHQVRKLLVNVEKFGHTFSSGLARWRHEEIIPRYHKADVDKFAFAHGPKYTETAEGYRMEGENFTSRHLASEEDARTWLVTP